MLHTHKDVIRKDKNKSEFGKGRKLTREIPPQAEENCK